MAHTNAYDITMPPNPITAIASFHQFIAPRICIASELLPLSFPDEKSVADALELVPAEALAVLVLLVAVAVAVPVPVVAAAVVPVVVAPAAADDVEEEEEEAPALKEEVEEVVEEEVLAPGLATPNTDCGAYVRPSGSQMAPWVQSCTADHSPDAHRWKVSVMQYQAPSESAQEEPTGNWSIRRRTARGAMLWEGNEDKDEEEKLVGVSTTEVGKSPIMTIGFMVIGLFRFSPLDQRIRYEMALKSVSVGMC